VHLVALNNILQMNLFQTDNTMLAAGLMSRDHGLRSAVKGPMDNILFNFEETDSLREDVAKFNDSSMEGNLVETFKNYKELLNLISKLKKA